jgi:hypothetical protein
VLAKESEVPWLMSLAETLGEVGRQSAKKDMVLLRQSEEMSLGGRNDAGIKLLFGAG